MKPLDRRGFLLATLGSLLTAGLIVVHVTQARTWLPWPTQELAISDRISPALIIMQLAGLFAFGLWGWFTARRFLALSLPRWPAILPGLFWVLAVMPLLAAAQVDGSVGFTGLEASLRDSQIFEFLTLTSLGLAALSIIAAAWCAVRGFRRDPTPVEMHFA